MIGSVFWRIINRSLCRKTISIAHVVTSDNSIFGNVEKEAETTPAELSERSQDPHVCRCEDAFFSGIDDPSLKQSICE